ncbi:MAG: hypothetical protein OXI96_01230 [Acidimicrobiaceae bacterium]|nr:hypothetical protein [Acidimicrobiaceae bacterium]
MVGTKNRTTNTVAAAHMPDTKAATLRAFIGDRIGGEAFLITGGSPCRTCLS